MPYYVGIDLGTTYTAAAVWRDGRVEIATLGTRAAVVPSVVLMREDGTVLVGEAAERRALTEPQRVTREFKRRFGDPTPIIVGGAPYSADALSARMLRWVVDAVTEREGGPPAAIVVSHPANWGPFKQDLLRQTFRMADLDEVTTVTEPEAAAIHYASQERVEPGATIAVYDLGGGTFDAAMLRRTDDRWEILGNPEGVERLGGIDFDQAVFHHVEESIGNLFEGLDPDEPTAMAAVARLRQECVEAKEALSSDVDVTIPVLLPHVQTEVRLTRSELESMIRPTLADSIAALRRAVRSAGVEPEDVQAVLLVGGSSRVPLVAQLVSSELRRPVAVDAHPKHSVALGAAILAAERGHGRAMDTEVVPSIEIMQVGAATLGPGAGRGPAPEAGPEPGPQPETASAGADPGPPTVESPVDVSAQLAALPDVERRARTAEQGPPDPMPQRITVPAPPVRPSPPPTQREAPRRPPPMVTTPRPPERRGAPTGRRSGMAGLGLILAALLVAAGVGAYLFANQEDDGDGGDGGDGGIDTTVEPSSQVDVNAVDEETDTGIDVAEGDRITITASGEIRDDVNGFPNRTFSPDGEPDPEDEHDDPVNDANHAALIARVGEEAFVVGSENTFTPEAPGRLILFVNDSRFDDNDGTFTAEITVEPA